MHELKKTKLFRTGQLLLYFGEIGCGNWLSLQLLHVNY